MVKFLMVTLVTLVNTLKILRNFWYHLIDGNCVGWGRGLPTVVTVVTVVTVQEN